MSINNNDRKYFSIVSDILEHPEFQKLKEVRHHGINRYDHSLRVSYYSYMIAKSLRLSPEEVARGALLHDFFLEDSEVFDSKKDRAGILVHHPKYALENASRYFTLSEIEKDIILTHMFPVSPMVPKYIESWLVDLVDDIASVYEKGFTLRKELSAAMSFLIAISINILR